jgi:hypothetical protein
MAFIPYLQTIPMPLELNSLLRNLSYAWNLIFPALKQYLKNITIYMTRNKIHKPKDSTNSLIRKVIGYLI